MLLQIQDAEHVSVNHFFYAFVDWFRLLLCVEPDVDTAIDFSNEKAYGIFAKLTSFEKMYDSRIIVWIPEEVIGCAGAEALAMIDKVFGFKSLHMFINNPVFSGKGGHMRTSKYNDSRLFCHLYRSRILCSLWGRAE